MRDFSVNGVKLDEIDKKIILHFQEGLEICGRPYFKAAQILDIPEEEVLQRLKALSANGFIRKNAVATNHYKLGYTFNAMSVWEVQPEMMNEVGEMFRELGFVSHCYERPQVLPDWKYNLFAMVHGRNQEEINEKISLMKKSISDKFVQMDLIYSTKILKKTGIRLKDNNYV